MRDPQPSQKSALRTLVAKQLLMVLAATSITALALGGGAFVATRDALWDAVDRDHPAAAERAARAVDAWLAVPGRDPGEAPEGPAGAELRRRLARERPTAGATVAWVDAEGRVRLAAGPAAGAASARLLALPGPRTSAVREYRDAAGVRRLGVAHPLASGRGFALVELPRADVFAPLDRLARRLLLLGGALVLAFGLAAYRAAAAFARPIRRLSEGAQRISEGDFDHEIPEPPRRDEIGRLTRSFNEMMRRLRAHQAEIEDANRDLTGHNLELRQAKEAFEQLSITDGLTRLHNHRFFQENLTREIKRVQRLRTPLSMLMIDIDDFKQLNDRLGHAAGDELLVGIARILNESVRESDLLARYGGEEFVVLASDTDLDGATRLAEKIRTAIAENSFILDDSLRPTRVTVSVGVAQYAGNRKRFFQASDRALYRAKAEGKNCVSVDDDSAFL